MDSFGVKRLFHRKTTTRGGSSRKNMDSERHQNICFKDSIDNEVIIIPTKEEDLRDLNRNMAKNSRKMNKNQRYKKRQKQHEKEHEEPRESTQNSEASHASPA